MAGVIQPGLTPVGGVPGAGAPAGGASNIGKEFANHEPNVSGPAARAAAWSAQNAARQEEARAALNDIGVGDKLMNFFRFSFGAAQAIVTSFFNKIAESFGDNKTITDLANKVADKVAQAQTEAGQIKDDERPTGRRGQDYRYEGKPEDYEPGAKE